VQLVNTFPHHGATSIASSLLSRLFQGLVARLYALAQIRSLKFVYAASVIARVGEASIQPSDLSFCNLIWNTFWSRRRHCWQHSLHLRLQDKSVAAGSITGTSKAVCLDRLLTQHVNNSDFDGDVFTLRSFASMHWDIGKHSPG
jgi:hypothetical protein